MCDYHIEHAHLGDWFVPDYNWKLPVQLTGIIPQLINGIKFCVSNELSPGVEHFCDAPIWKDEDHPELKNGAYAWVRQMRDDDDQRSKKKLGDWLEPRE